MTLLARYLTKNNLTLLLLLCVVIATLYCIFNFIDNKSVMSLAPSLWTIIKYYLLSIPYIITLLFSLLFFLSIVIQCTIMVKNKEFLALLSSGISIPQIITIFFYYSLLLVCGSFLITEAGILAEQEARSIYRYEIRKRPKVAQHINNIWFKKDNLVVHIATLIPEERRAETISLYHYDPKLNTIKELTSAPHGVLQKEALELQNAKQINFLHSSIETIPKLLFPLKLDIDAIKVANTKLTELTFLSILKTITPLKHIGFDTTSLYAALHTRVTNALAVLIMGMLALLIGLSVSNSYLAIGISILTAVIFFLSRQLLETLARLNIVNPSLAPWILLLSWGFICILIAYRKSKHN